ncbi:unnamed protein product [Euphydryas editha]|uniref:Gustatory receptor n=1 Tax=Euphydryas editha TaxID=104508 RepID=A0AAU9U9H3_EUPED|nr:unnamed protein product [Euphydryas editha]
MEYLLVKAEIFQATKAFNKKLRQIIDDLKSDSVTAYTIRSNCESVRELMKVYVTICELVDTLNKDYGLDMFMLFASSSVSLMVTLFNFIDITNVSSKSIRRNSIAQLFWIVWHFTEGIIFVEPSHLINEEVVEIRNQLTHLMYDMTPVGKPVAFQLDLMSKQLILIEPQIAPLQIYTVQRSLYTKALTFITTYLVIIIQNAKNQRWS